MSERKHIDVEEFRGVQVVRCKDPHLFGDTQHEWREELFALVEENCRILLNFSTVISMDSLAFQGLIILDRRVKKVGGKLIFSNMRPEIYDVFEITRWDQVFNIQEGDAAALEQFDLPQPVSSGETT